MAFSTANKNEFTDGGSAPFLKWPGGKRRMVPFLTPHLKLPTKKLIEPFCGACALSLAVPNQAEEFWLNDINQDLINLMKQVCADPDDFLVKAKSYFTARNNKEGAYYRLRGKFNTTNDNLERAALFLYLNRHGYNGLCRYNAAGEFNVPFGRYVAPYFPEHELRNAVPLFLRSKITCVDFEKVMDSCKSGDSIYCDPPYVPLSDTASFTTYSAGGFGLADQERLALAAERAAKRGAVVVISNHDTPVTRKLYRKASKHYLQEARRNISCDGENRALVMEVIAVYRPG